MCFNTHLWQVKHAKQINPFPVLLSLISHYFLLTQCSPKPDFGSNMWGLTTSYFISWSKSPFSNPGKLKKQKKRLKPRKRSSFRRKSQNYVAIKYYSGWIIFRSPQKIFLFRIKTMILTIHIKVDTRCDNLLNHLTLAPRLVLVSWSQSAVNIWRNSSVPMNLRKSWGHFMRTITDDLKYCFIKRKWRFK